MSVTTPSNASPITVAAKVYVSSASMSTPRPASKEPVNSSVSSTAALVPVDPDTVAAKS